MLGLFLIICLLVFVSIEIKAYSLLKDDYSEPVEIDSNGRTYNVCYHAAVLCAISKLVVLLGYIGCAWPYLFIEVIDRTAYLKGIVMLGFVPVSLTAVFCHYGFKGARGHIKIGTEEIEYKRHKSFSVKISDIKKITSPSRCSYQIHLKEKGKRPLHVNLEGFYKKEEIRSLMKQLRDYLVKVSGQDRSLVSKIGFGRLGIILGKYCSALFKIVIGLLVVYTSYCCIDYDFFREDRISRFNDIGADHSQNENAWPYYVQAAVNYTDLEESFQKDIKNSLESGQLDLTDKQADDLKRWFNENASSWASLKKAVSINYCNATYEQMSLVDSMGREDFSSPSDTGYSQIRHLYSNAKAGCLAGVLDLDWFDLFQMQLISSKHFANGKTCIDQLVGYEMVRKSIKLLAEQDSYDLEDLQKARKMVREHFPAGLPSLSIEGEILIVCNFYDDTFSVLNIPIQTPLNPMFLMYGSSTGVDAYVRKHYTAVLEQSRKGIAVEPKGYSITGFPIMRNMFLSVLDESIARVYKISQRACTNLLAAYFLLDLEEYQLIKGCYPVDVSQLRQAGLASQLPDDPDSDSEIIYLNDSQRAILYAVGANNKNDGGYKDDKGSDQKRDDIIYWQRSLKDESE